MSRIAWACLLGFLVGCGPTADVGDEEGETAQGSTSQAGPADGSDADVSSTSSTVTSDSSTGEEETAIDEPLAPSEHVSAEIRCQEDGLAQLLVEADLGLGEPRSEACTFLGLDDGYLLIVIRDWHGGPGQFDVHPGGQALAATGDETLEGTVTIEAFAPLHPTIMHVDLVGETTSLQGTLDLQTCGSIPDHC